MLQLLEDCSEKKESRLHLSVPGAEGMPAAPYAARKEWPKSLALVLKEWDANFDKTDGSGPEVSKLVVKYARAANKGSKWTSEVLPVLLRRHRAWVESVEDEHTALVAWSDKGLLDGDTLEPKLWELLARHTVGQMVGVARERASKK